MLIFLYFHLTYIFVFINLIYTVGDKVLMKEMVKYRFGDKLRDVRERKGITMKTVAQKVKLSESLISQIERNKVSPSIDTLFAVAEVLEIDLDYLFRDYKQTKKVDLVRKEERQSIVTPQVTYSRLSVIHEGNEEHAIEAFLMEIEPGSEKGSVEYGHTGKELGFILKGQGELVYGKETYFLREG